MVDKFILYDQKDIINTTFVNLYTTVRCQLNCSYCVEKNVMSKQFKEKDVSIKLFESIIEFIKKQNTKNVFFHFYGGEPLLNSKTPIFIEYLKNIFKEKIKIKVSTNLECNQKILDSIPTYIDVWASYHWYGYRDKHLEEWMEKALILQKREILKKLFLMCSESNHQTIYDVYLDYKSKFKTMKIYPIDQFRKSEVYQLFKRNFKFDEHDPFEDYQVIDIIDDGKKFEGIPSVEKFNRFRGCLCNSGFDIFPNGDVRYCSGDDKIILNLSKDTPRQIERYHICKSDNCSCAPEFGKYSIKYYLGELIRK